jgi:hypothetical protein
MSFIIAQLIGYIKQQYHRSCHAKSQAGNINQLIELLPRKAAQNYYQIYVSHIRINKNIKQFEISLFEPDIINAKIYIAGYMAIINLYL